MKYELEKSPKPKGTCPFCGHKKTWRYYEGLPKEFGICDRAAKCGEHNKPTATKLKELGHEPEARTPEGKPKLKVVSPGIEDIACLQDLSSPFHQFCINKLKIDEAHLRKWKVGTQGVGTKFVYARAEDCPVNVVTINYTITVDGNNCKRIKEKFPFSLKARAGEKYELCLFGEHLLTDKIICLVESEKTAVIASFFYPQFDWLATGGANKLTDEKIEILFNREIYYINDADKAGKDNSTLKKLKGYKLKYQVIDLFPERNDGYDLADAIIEGHGPEISVATTKLVDVATKGKNKHEMEADTLNKFGFFERNNEYYIRQQFKNSSKDIVISNFTMKWLYRLDDGSNNIPMLFELIKNDGNNFFLEITSKDLLTSTNFSASILKGGYNFNGTSYVFKNILQSIYAASEEATYLTTLGQCLNEDFYVFHNGILNVSGEYTLCNEHGVVEHNDKHFFIKSGKKENLISGEFVEERKFKFVPGTLTLEVLAEKLYNLYGIAGYVGLCYGIATIHRDIIFSETKFFPFLFLYGPKGSGKSTYANFFMGLFGDPQPETTENSTDKAIERKFSQINNNLQYVKEFNSSFEMKIKDILKNAYDGVGYSRAAVSQNNKTNTAVVRSGLIIDGNYFPTKDDALFSRLIFLIWKPHFAPGTKTLIQELQDLYTQGNGRLFAEIYGERPKYQEDFKKLYRSTISEVKEHCRKKKISFTEREVSHIALIATVFKITLCRILNSEAYNLFVDMLISGTQKQAQISESIDDVSKFFEALETLHQRGFILEQRHFIREHGVGYDHLFINFNLCQLEYAKLAKETGDKFLISKEELKQKLEFMASKTYDYNKPDEIYFQKKFSGQNARCLVFDVEPWAFTLFNKA